MKNEVKIGLVVAVVLLLLIFGIAWVNNNNNKADDNIVTFVERNLTAEDRKVFEDRVLESKNKLSQASDETEKYNLYLRMGYDEYALGRLQESKNSFEEAIKINSEQHDVYVGLFQTQFEMKDVSGAEKSIKKAISIRKGIADLWKKYIQTKIELAGSSNDETNAIFAEAIDDIINNGDRGNLIDIYTFYAGWIEKSGDLAKAKEAWQKAIELDPDRKAVFEAEIKRIDVLIKQLP